MHNSGTVVTVVLEGEVAARALVAEVVEELVLAVYPSFFYY